MTISGTTSAGGLGGSPEAAMQAVFESLQTPEEKAAAVAFVGEANRSKAFFDATAETLLRFDAGTAGLQHQRQALEQARNGADALVAALNVGHLDPRSLNLARS